MSSLIKSFFIPDATLQGAEIPIHVIWDSKENVEIQISYPSDIMILEEIYNVKGNLKFIQNSLFLSQFEVNGYVGLLFKSKICEKPSVYCPIKILVKTESGMIEPIEQEILLSRPQIMIETPAKILITTNRAGYAVLRDRIKISNIGKATAIVAINATQDSDIIIEPSDYMKEFVEKFYLSLIENLSKIIKDFPQFAQLIERLIEIMRANESLLEFTKETLNNLNKVMEELSKAFESNHDFLLAFAEAFVGAYLSNANIITEIHSFIEYLKSITMGRILFHKAFNIIEVKPGINRFKGYLIMTDRMLNFYAPIDISTEIELQTNSTVKLPICSLFEVVPGGVLHE